MQTIKLHKREEELIEEVIGEFDFQIVKKTMDFLNWGWGFNNQVPNIPQLKESARNRIISAVEGIKSDEKHSYRNSYFSSSGGLKATVWKNKHNYICHIQLEFVLTDWGTF
jgi:hypothetical protein